MALFQRDMGVSPGAEWEPFRRTRRAGGAAFGCSWRACRWPGRLRAGTMSLFFPVTVPAALPDVGGRWLSTQEAFGGISRGVGGLQPEHRDVRRPTSRFARELARLAAGIPREFVRRLLASTAAAAGTGRAAGTVTWEGHRAGAEPTRPSARTAGTPKAAPPARLVRRKAPIALATPHITLKQRTSDPCFISPHWPVLCPVLRQPVALDRVGDEAVGRSS